MTYTVRLHGITLGRAELSQVDAAKGVARSLFHPAPGYQLVQDVFRLYSEAVPDTPGSVNDAEKLQQYYKARDALGLELLDSEGRGVKKATVHLYERAVGDQKKKKLHIEVHTSDRRFWRKQKNPQSQADPPGTP